jgi:CRISPR/Cas system CSM-associated protein Csm3 (group 7 of RAMP superfamily)
VAGDKRKQTRHGFKQTNKQMRYTFKDLVNMVPVVRRAEFTKIYEYLHKVDNPHENDILEKVSKHFEVPTADIKSDKRFADVVLARQMYVTAVKVCSTKSLAEVARTVNKDHATVCHAMKTIKGDYSYNAVRRNKIRHFIADLDPTKQELLLDFFNERNPDILASYSVEIDRVTAPAESEA